MDHAFDQPIVFIKHAFTLVVFGKCIGKNLSNICQIEGAGPPKNFIAFKHGWLSPWTEVKYTQCDCPLPYCIMGTGKN